MGSLCLDIKVSQMALILQEPNYEENYQQKEYATLGFTPVEKQMPRKEKNLIYMFLFALILVCISAITTGTSTMPQEPTTPTTTTSTTTTVTYNTTTTPGKPCLHNCYEENEQGTCNTTTGICACNPDQPKYKFCGPDCNI